ncbi:unnamed protein product [Angiostrongylus costaricensis]|uniref:Uncharacterized protein n=1 Tax=Angiostrongylus costaricensis TaxID=334426 RepID=A0A158PKN1_ANGCS|nr:unnamed protein product [Angiostrongylus costaricensis]
MHTNHIVERSPLAGKDSDSDANAAISRGGMQMQFYLGLHTTVCFRLEEGVTDPLDHDHQPSRNQVASSWLYTIRLDRLEHHHPVTQRYQFGIPEVKADCICECNAASESCTAESHQYTQCPEDPKRDFLTSCYRTFLPNQSPIGCPTGSNAKLCCDVKFRPYRNQTYTAVKLEQPTTFATFVYTAYDYNNGRWIEKDRSTIRSQLDGGTQERYVDSLRRIALSVSSGGRTTHQLETGMYFANSNPGGEMEELRKQPLNEITDNNFDRLGWYRMDENGKFHVNNGIVKMEEIHKAKVKNCHEQTYRSIINAKNYLPGNFNLSRPLEMVYPWIQSARIYDGSQRQVIVTHAEGSNLHVTLQVHGEADGNRLVFFHNASRISDFTGTIIVDSRSNRYFNVTMYGASGKINGAVKYSTERNSDEIFSFTTYVHDLNASNRSMIIPMPAIVDSGSRMICMYADEQREEQAVCRIIQYYETPLETFAFTSGEPRPFHESKFFRFLNPMSWVNGVSSLGEFVMMATDVLVYVCVLVVVYVVLTKIVIPICKCWICPMYIMSHSESKSKKRQKAHQRTSNEGDVRV